MSESKLKKKSKRAVRKLLYEHTKSTSSVLRVLLYGGSIYIDGHRMCLGIHEWDAKSIIQRTGI